MSIIAVHSPWAIPSYQCYQSLLSCIFKHCQALFSSISHPYYAPWWTTNTTLHYQPSTLIAITNHHISIIHQPLHPRVNHHWPLSAMRISYSYCIYHLPLKINHPLQSWATRERTISYWPLVNSALVLAIGHESLTAINHVTVDHYVPQRHRFVQTWPPKLLQFPD